MKVKIIGAGITGLSIAYFLTQEGHKVTVFDCCREVGGLAGFFPIAGTYLEKYYHHSFIGHTELVELMKALRVDKDFFFRKVKMGFFHSGHLYSFVTAKDLLSFKPLKVTSRLRLGMTSLFMARIKDWRSLEKKSALEWLRSYSGEQSCVNIWEPLLKSKFGDDYYRISAAWLWNRVVDRRGLNTKGGGKEFLGYIRGGYKTLLDALIKSIEINGGKIKTGTPVEQILLENGKCCGIQSNDELHRADVVISTVSIPSFLKLCSFFPEKYKSELENIKYQGSICVVLKLKKPLSKYYWINVSDPKCPFVGIIEHTNLVSPEKYGNRHLVYLTKYSSPQHSIFNRSEERIFREFVDYLSKIFPNFSEKDVEEYWVFQDRFSQPVFVQNYSKIMPEISTPIQNLYLLNTTQIYPQSRSINSSIAKAKEVVKKILDRHAD